MNSAIIKMSNAYETMGLCNRLDEPMVVDCREITGTKCYLDELALTDLLSRVETIPVEGIHFIDSGNYHYLSLLLLQRITTPFSLVMVDRHPDMQSPLFGDIISCGGWLQKAIDDIPNLQSVYLYGVDERLLGELSPLSEKVVIIDCKNISLKNVNMDIPIYLSIDKDALSIEYAMTDWDQGEITLDELMSFLTGIISGREVIGCDICGDTSVPTGNSDIINLNTNQALIDFFGNFL